MDNQTLWKNLKSIFKTSVSMLVIFVTIVVFFAWRDREHQAQLSSVLAKQELLTKLLEKQTAQAAVLRVVDEKLGKKISPETKAELVQTLINTCTIKNIPYSLVLGIIQVESTWDPKVKSSAGAMGLMQVMPQYAKPYLRLHQGTDNSDELYNVVSNVRTGIWMLADAQAQLVEQDKTRATDFTLALLAFNAGPKSAANTKSTEYAVKVARAAKTFNDIGIP